MERKGILEVFATHPVAMNVLMLIILSLGAVSLKLVNFQFFPTFELQFVVVNTVWPGASAEDVEQSITNRLELDLKNLDNLEESYSTSRIGHSEIILRFPMNVDIQAAIRETEQAVALVASTLPDEADPPEVIHLEDFEIIAGLIVTADKPDQLRRLANQFKEELIAAGIGRVQIEGLPEEEIAIQVPSHRLRELQMNLNQIGEKIGSASIDAPIGILGRDDSARQLRFAQQRRSELEFENIPIVADEYGSLVKLKDIAEIERRAKPDQVTVTHQNKPAAILKLDRLESDDTLESAQILYDWVAQKRRTLPPSVDLYVYDDRSTALRDRLEVLVKNGLVGLLLVLTVLFVFLNVRLAFWVAAGIPVSILGAMGLLYLFGGSLNMVTLFAFIMTLGIIVDDAIVVGEDALLKFKSGLSPAEAVQRASRYMFLPIIAASLTTIFAFTPVAIVPDTIGTLLRSLALVVICVVVISVIEAFLILPGHLHHSFKGIRSKEPSRFSVAFDRLYYGFQNQVYRTLLIQAINRPVLTISIGVALLILTLGLFGSGRLQYNFFPTPELDRIFANVSFVAGTPRNKVDEYLADVEEALHETNEDFGGGLISSYYVQHGATLQADERSVPGSQHGSIVLEMTPADERDVRVSQFIRAWQGKLEMVPGLEKLIVTTPTAGPPGFDIEIYFSGDDRDSVKNASLALSQHLRNVKGVFGIKDDTSYGYQQRVMQLTSKGEALGLTVSEIARQLRSAIEGRSIQSYTSKLDEIDVVPKLPDAERNHLSAMENMHVQLASGQSVPLFDVVRFESVRGFDALKHQNNVFTISVTADVDPGLANTREILRDLERGILPSLVQQHGVKWVYGRSTNVQVNTENAMKLGAVIALVLIYLTLTAIFGSYTWPVFVMLAIPFGVVGAAWGHYFLGLTVSIITVFGLIGLSGIVVNNAIVLVVRYKDNLEEGLDSKTAMIEAGCRRLRPVLLSSMTTVVGLLPLLFEKSTQAQFLIPMVATISFGLAFSTILVLLFVPAVLTFFDDARGRARSLLSSKQLPSSDEAVPSA